MTGKEADSIIDFAYGVLRPPDKELTRSSWRTYLEPLDPGIASDAMINGAQVWEHWPSWKEFMVEYRALHQRLHSEDSYGIAKIHCATCVDLGLVLVKMRYDRLSLARKEKVHDRKARVGPFEEWAPCPSCPRGRLIETQQYENEGYWRGRDFHPEHEPEGVFNSKEKLTWVHRWERARAAGDRRPFAEQYEYLTPEERPKKPFSDVTAWVQSDEYAYGLA